MEDKELSGRLKLAKPAALRVYEVGREETTMIEISPKRDRWKKALESLSKLNWQRIDCLTREGAVCAGGVIVDDAPDDAQGDYAFTTELMPTDKDSVPSKAERRMYMMINAQRLALENNQRMLQPILDAFKSVCEMNNERLAALEKDRDALHALTYENALLRAQADGTADSDVNAEIVKGLMERLEIPGLVKRKSPANGKKQLTNGSKK